MKREDSKKIKMLTYVGSKFGELKKIDEIIKPLIENAEKPVFVDLFAGSGVVGFYVHLVYGIPVIYNEKNSEQFDIINLCKDPEKLHKFYEWYALQHDGYNNADEDAKLAIFKTNLDLYHETKNIFNKIVLQQLSYRGIVKNNGSTIPNMRKKNDINFMSGKLKPLDDIKKFYEFINCSDIKLVNSDYRTILEKYKNDPNAIIYMDPPYLRDKNILGYLETIDMDDFLYIRNMFKSPAKCILHIDYNAHFREDLFKEYYHSCYPKKYGPAAKNTKLFYDKYHAFFQN